MDASTSISSGCAVCGDKVNGNRYGVPACLGCIVFFRRSIVKQSVFQCQRHGKCEIDHKSRCTCRYCRLQKCLRVGMNPNSIQRRDMMGPRKKRVKEEELSPEMETTLDVSPRPPSLPLSANTTQPDQLLIFLAKMQDRQRQVHRSWFSARGPHPSDPSFIDGIFDLVSALNRLHSFAVISPPSCSSTPSSGGSSSASSASASPPRLYHQLLPPLPLPLKTEPTDEYYSDELRRARKEDVNVMVHLGIVDAIEWGSQFPIFSDLPTCLKRELLKEYAIGFMLVDQGYNTSKQADDTLWILQHEKVYMCADYMRGLPKEEQALPISETKAKVHPDFVVDCINGLGIPMREMQIELFECVVLKSLLLFECFNVYPRERRSEMVQIRERCLQSLAAYESVEHPHDGIERIGTLLLMIANIRNCIVTTCRQISLSDVFSLMSFDPLVSDVILNTCAY